MPVPLRMDVKPRPTPPPPIPEPEPEQRLQEVLDLSRLPAPIVTVAPPDLSAIVTAVTSLKPGPTAAEIAAAIADVIRPSSVSEEGAPALREVAEALKTLDFRLQGLGRQAYGGGSVSLQPNQSITVANQLVPTAYDEIDLTYDGDNVSVVNYKRSGSTVATLTLTYVGTNVTRVVRT